MAFELHERTQSTTSDTHDSSDVPAQLRASSACGQILCVSVPLPPRMRGGSAKVSLHVSSDQDGKVVPVPVASIAEVEEAGVWVLRIASRQPVHAKTVVVRLDSEGQPSAVFRVEVPPARAGTDLSQRIYSQVPPPLDDALLDGLGRDVDSSVARAVRKSEHLRSARASQLRELLEQRQEAARLEADISATDLRLEQLQRHIEARRAALKQMRTQLAGLKQWEGAGTAPSSVEQQRSEYLTPAPGRAHTTTWRDVGGLTDTLSRSFGAVASQGRG